MGFRACIIIVTLLGIARAAHADGGIVKTIDQPVQANGANNSGTAQIDCSHPPTGSWGVADPIVQRVWDAQCKTSHQISGNGGAGVANSSAEAAKAMTGDVKDSQQDLQKDTKMLQDYAKDSSRDVGNMDIAQGFVYLAIKPLQWLAGQFFDSGHKAHDAANQLDQLAAKTAQNGGLMNGMNSVGATGGGAGTGNGGNAGSGGVNGSGASSAHGGSAEADRVYGALESATGVARDEFVDAANRAHGDPEALGDFMQEKTGNEAFGRDSVKAAMEAYAGNPGGQGLDLAAMAALAGKAQEEVVARPSGPVPSSPVASAHDPGVTRQVASITLPKKDSLRDKLKRSLADKGSPEDFGKETLEPLRDDELFRQAGNAGTQEELSLFEVVHAKYHSLHHRLSPAVRNLGAPLPHGI